MNISHQQLSAYPKMFQSGNKCHPQKKDLSLWYEPHYCNVGVNVSKGPMIQEYMDGLIDTYKKHKQQYARVFAVMVSLYFPQNLSVDDIIEVDYYSRFMASLKAQLESHDNRRRQAGDGRSNQVRFCRVYEVGSGRGVHIHAVLFFNGHAFRCLGDFNSTQENLYHRIVNAWGSALGMYPCAVTQAGLIHVSKDGYLIDEGPNKSEKAMAMFKHFSYICKAETKWFDPRIKTISRSRG